MFFAYKVEVNNADRMNYYSPGNPVVIRNEEGENILYIPRYQQKRDRFSYTSPGPIAKVMTMDTSRDMSKNYLSDLRDLAWIIGVPSDNMRKRELVDLLSRRIVFE